MGRAGGSSSGFSGILRRPQGLFRRQARTGAAAVLAGDRRMARCSEATAEEIRTYTRGACHYFALALHEQTGWQIRGLGWPEDEHSLRRWHGLSGAPQHLYCLNEDGLPVDVTGVYSSERAIKEVFSWGESLDAGEEYICVDLDADDIRFDLPEFGYAPLYDRELRETRRVVEKLFG